MTDEQKRHRAIMNGAMKAEWAESMMMTCPNPAVMNVYGTNKVCIWICKSCKYVTHPLKYCGAVGCGYGKDESDK